MEAIIEITVIVFLECCWGKRSLHVSERYWKSFRTIWIVISEIIHVDVVEIERKHWFNLAKLCRKRIPQNKFLFSIYLYWKLWDFFLLLKRTSIFQLIFSLRRCSLFIRGSNKKFKTNKITFFTVTGGEAFLFDYCNIYVPLGFILILIFNLIFNLLTQKNLLIEFTHSYSN